MIRLALIGYGYWGPVIAKNFSSHEAIKISAIADQDPKNLSRAKKDFPLSQTSQNFLDFTHSSSIDVVAIATPVSSHFDIAKSSLENGKHVFIEKPFTETSEQAKALIELSLKKNRIIMVDYILLFTGAIKKAKKMIENDSIGKPLYYDSQRANLGIFRKDVNVIWDLAPHDLAVMNFLFQSTPHSLAAHGMDHFGRGIENTAYLTLYYDEMIAHLNMSWLSPIRIRRTIIGGEKKMLVLEDKGKGEKIRLYDKGLDITHCPNSGNEQIFYRKGKNETPRLEQVEALKAEADYLVHCIQQSKTPINSGESALKVIQILEACNRSIQNQGALTPL